MADHGVAGARDLLKRSSENDPRLAERLQRLRERLRRQAARHVGQVLEQYDRRTEALRLVEVNDEERLAAERARLEAWLKSGRPLDLARLQEADLLSDVESALLLPSASWMQPPPKPGLWARVRALFARIAAFFRRLFGGRSKRTSQEPEGRPMTFAVAGGLPRSLGASDIGDVLARMSPAQRQELDTSLARAARDKGRGITREAEEKRRHAEAQRRELEAEREAARRRAEAESDRLVDEAENRRLARELKERGFVAERHGELAVTYGLITQFARLVLQDETRELPGDVRFSMSGTASTGVYEKARLRQPDEVAHLDLPSSLLAARQSGLRHIDETTSYVYREVTSERVHVVVMFDKSGSMAEGGKLMAAKKALLALYVAIRRRYPDAVVDVVAFDNEVRLMDLLELWECHAGAFTNTGDALRTAHVLLRASRANRREVYVVTDGLPEAYTDADGRVRSGNLEAAMAVAQARAQELATIPGLKFAMILLKSDHPEYETAARILTRALSGELVVTDPDRLGVELLVRWARGAETTRAPADATRAPGALPVPPAARPKRKKVDRRMGG
ncbi:MAG: hypothetical protein WCA77_09675 [Thermoplasmata archaeon]